MRARHQRFYSGLSIPDKANKVLHFILIALLLILLRIWHLSVIQSSAKQEEASRPQRKVVIEPAKRATIRDRFNIPLAINKIQYNASIVYAQLKSIPMTQWEKGPDGKKVKVAKRRQYISELSKLLGRELNLDADRIEDLIYSKASFNIHVPFVIKEDISEREYYRLKMLEKDWFGIQATHAPKRYYPLHKVASDIIGYTGAINRSEYEAVLGEMRSLEELVSAMENGEEPELPEKFRFPGEVRARLKELREKAYTLSDHVGKTGIEGRFESILRGFHGKKQYFSDAKGNFLRELPGAREPLAGQRILLSISSELQEYAEGLLIQNEQVRKARISNAKGLRITLPEDKQPWIKGGAIVAMDPKTGEILAMASHPRLNPNDFTPSGNQEEAKEKASHIHQWFENDNYLADLWNGVKPLTRERYHSSSETFEEESKLISWEVYLNLVLSKESKLRDFFARHNSVEAALDLQKTVESLLEMAGITNLYLLLNTLYTPDTHTQYGMKPGASQREEIMRRLQTDNAAYTGLKRKLDAYLSLLPHQYDKVLAVDLMQLVIDPKQCATDDCPKLSISAYRELCAAKATLQPFLRKMARDVFHDTIFKEWRVANEKSFLKEKRAEETAAKKYPRPYLDHLDAKENELFTAFWQDFELEILRVFLGEKSTGSQSPIIAHFQDWAREIKGGAYSQAEWRRAYTVLESFLKRDTLGDQLLKSMRSYADLNRPLYGRYKQLRSQKGVQLEKHLASAYYPVAGFGYGRSQGYRQSATQGSLFKIVTAYEALIQRFRKMKELGLDKFSLNPLEITDTLFQQGSETFLGYSADGKPLPRHYKGGRLPRSANASLGRMDIIKAIETSSNVYFALIAGDILDDPNDLADAARLFSFGAQTGIDLPAEIKGNVPNDLDVNRTGLYATAIGQHTLVVTPLQTCVMLSTIANGGKVLKPKIVHMTAGRKPDQGESLLNCPPKFCYQETLALGGIDFPLFTSGYLQDQKNLIKLHPPELKRELYMPKEVRETILEGMRRVVSRTQGESVNILSNVYKEYPEAISDYVELKNELIGKTSTSESMERIDLDVEKGVNMFTHVWFGGVAFEEPLVPYTYTAKDRFGKPELVVAVYLRYGGYGKEAAPVAAQIVKKWREIKQRHAVADTP